MQAKKNISLTNCKVKLKISLFQKTYAENKQNNTNTNKI